MKKAKLFITFLLTLLCMSLVSGCSFKGAKRDEAVSGENSFIDIYYLASSETALEIGQYELDNSYDAETNLENVKDELSEVPDPLNQESLLSDGVEIKSLSHSQEGTLTLDFNSEYKRMTSSREVLVRAGIVKTFCQIDGVRNVQFTVEGEPLKGKDGNPTGLMNENSFVDNSGQNVNSYEKDNVRLFFTDQTGEVLVREDRTIYHASNQSLEWAVVERLIGGPMVSGYYATIPVNTEIISVSTNNDICYVNLSGEFMNNTSNAKGKITIYSIVNSIVESCKVEQVQIAVKGEMKLTYKDDIDLDKIFTEDLSLVRDSGS